MGKECGGGDLFGCLRRPRGTTTIHPNNYKNIFKPTCTNYISIHSNQPTKLAFIHSVMHPSITIVVPILISIITSNRNSFDSIISKSYIRCRKLHVYLPSRSHFRWYIAVVHNTVDFPRRLLLLPHTPPATGPPSHSHTPTHTHTMSSLSGASS